MKLGISIYSISRKIINGEMSAEKGVEWLADIGAEIIEIVPFGIDIVENKTLAVELNKIAVENGGEIVRPHALPPMLGHIKYTY